MADDDPFNLSKIALTAEQVTELAPRQKRSESKKRMVRADFVRLPYERALAAAGRLGDAPLAVLVELAYQRFKMHQNQVPLTNTVLRSVGIRPRAKLRVLRQLEAVGLVRVAWRGRRAPLVTLLWE